MPLLTKRPSVYPKQRNEWEHHADFILEPGDHLKLVVGRRVVFEEICPQKLLLHIHYAIAVEPEPLMGGPIWWVISRLWKMRDRLLGRWEEEVFGGEE